MCVCKNTLSVNHIRPQCPTTTESFQKNGYDFNACTNVRDILYNTDVIASIVKLFAHSHAGKLVGGWGTLGGGGVGVSVITLL